MSNRADFPRPFVPIDDLPGCGSLPEGEGGPSVGTAGERTGRGAVQTDLSFIAKQRAVLEARRRRGTTLTVLADDGRILRIAPDGAETDVTAELNREVARVPAGDG